MKKASIVSSVVVVVVAIAMFSVQAVRRTRERQIPEEAIRHLKNTSLRIANSLSYELQDSNVTYKELFDTIEKDLTEIDSKIIDVETLETAANRDNVEPLVEYLQAVQDVLRAQEALSRKELAVRSAYESVSEAVRDLRTSTYYGYEYARRAEERAEEQANKASAELTVARETFRKSLEKLAKKRENIETVVPSDALCSPTLTKRVLKKIASTGPA